MVAVGDVFAGDVVVAAVVVVGDAGDVDAAAVVAVVEELALAGVVGEWEKC